MSSGHIAVLARRGVVAVEGPDAEKFINDLVTADVGRIRPGQAVFAALLTPQCKILIDGVAAPDPRLAALGWRVVAPADQPPVPHGFASASEANYDAHRIPLGIPEGGIDFAFGDAFPHDADMDQLSGVDFGKGCYVGQEVVSRMEHRGTARRRFVIAAAEGPLPAAGTEVTAGGKPLGTLGSSAGNTGLALVRLDRAREAIDAGTPILAGDATLTLTLPGWARFGWPAGSDRD
jgi:folate-binding protein YgfZ